MQATSYKTETFIQNEINVNEYLSAHVIERLLYITQKENFIRVIEERHKEKEERKYQRQKKIVSGFLFRRIVGRY